MAASFGWCGSEGASPKRSSYAKEAFVVKGPVDLSTENATNGEQAPKNPQKSSSFLVGGVGEAV